MALQGNYSAHSSASPSASSVASSGATSAATASFSVFQEGPGQALLFSPPHGTPELQRLIDVFITLDIPASMKMEMIQRDFETHSQRTGERYKIYSVPSSSVASAPVSVTSTPSITSPATVTASPSPVFPTVFDPSFGAGGSVSAASGSGSIYVDASPVSAAAGGPSPSGSDMTTGSDHLYSLSSVPMFPATTSYATANSFQAVAPAYQPISTVAAAGSWQASSKTSSFSSSSSTRQHRHSHQHRHHSHQPTQRRHLSSNDSSMQILTRTGEDVTHMSSRSTRTREERENTRIVRQRGACADCRRKKIRCSPGHLGKTLNAGDRVERSAPYAAPAQSGRAKEQVAAAHAARAAKSKAQGKRPAAAYPAIIAPQQSSTPSLVAGRSASGDGIGGGGGGGGIGIGQTVPSNSWNMFDDASFDWSQMSELDFNLDASLTAAEAASALLAEVPIFDQGLSTTAPAATTLMAPTTQPRVPRASQLLQTPGGGLAGTMTLMNSEFYSTSASSSSSSASSSSSSPLHSSLNVAQRFSTVAMATAAQDSRDQGRDDFGVLAGPAHASQQLFSLGEASGGSVAGEGGSGGTGLGSNGLESAGESSRAEPGGSRRVSTRAGATDSGISGQDSTSTRFSGGRGNGVSGRLSGLAESSQQGGGGLAAGVGRRLQGVEVEVLEGGEERGGEEGREGQGRQSRQSGQSGQGEQHSLHHQRLPRDHLGVRTSVLQVIPRPEDTGVSASSSAASSTTSTAAQDAEVSPQDTATCSGDEDTVDDLERRRRPRTTEEIRRGVGSGQEEESGQEEGESAASSASLSVSPTGDEVEKKRQGVSSSTSKDNTTMSFGSLSEPDMASVELLAGMSSLVSSLIPLLLAWAAAHPSGQEYSEVRDQPVGLALGSMALVCH